MGEPLERHFASLDRITKLERDLAEAERQRNEARNDAAALGEEASRAWAVLVGRGQDWQAGRVLGSCVTEAERVVRERDDYTERYKVAMANGLRAIAERDEARRAALRWEGNADAAERETATHRRAAERCVIELAEAQRALSERVAEREALCERVSALEETLAKVRPDVCREDSIDALDAALTDTAAAAEAYARSVEAKALEEAADRIDAGKCRECAAVVRAMADEIRGGR